MEAEAKADEADAAAAEADDAAAKADDAEADAEEAADIKIDAVALVTEAKDGAQLAAGEHEAAKEELSMTKKEARKAKRE